MVSTGGYFAPKGSVPPSQKLAPTKLNIFASDYVSSTSFRRRLRRGDLAFALSHSSHSKVAWRAPPSSIDFAHYLPTLFEGLCEENDNLAGLATAALSDLLNLAGVGDRILAAVPHCILPITRALHTRDARIVCRTMRAIQHLLRADPRVGGKLVPYYSHFVPAISYLGFAGFKGRHTNRGRTSDAIEYSQRFGENVDDLVEGTLRSLQKSGGPNALAAIKHFCPTFGNVKF
ncbi:parkin co-regulated protein [Hyaloraphidium curvatum]|nr:parkin co-regulated protein [Hyaloraphidium curvatum]